MTGPDHFKAAERCIEAARKAMTEYGANTTAALGFAEAQAHATLALAAATVANNQMLGVEAATARVEWQRAVSDAR